MRLVLGLLILMVPLAAEAKKSFLARGDYGETCTGCHIEHLSGTVMLCHCKAKDGSVHDAGIAFLGCKALQVVNDDGKLVCELGDRPFREQEPDRCTKIGPHKIRCVNQQ